MAAQNFTGIIEKFDVKQRKPFDPYIGRYSPNSEYYEVYGEVCIRLADGSAIYFNTPACMMTVANCPGAAIVTFDIGKTAATWFRETGEQRVATPGRSNDNRVEPTAKVGETVTIRGTVKAEKVSKAGKPYRSMNRVSRTDNVPTNLVSFLVSTHYNYPGIVIRAENEAKATEQALAIRGSQTIVGQYKLSCELPDGDHYTPEMFEPIPVPVVVRK